MNIYIKNGSIVYMSEGFFHLKPWSITLKQAADDIIDQIHNVVPNLEILFMGSAALGLPGENDIDLDILCDSKDLDNITLSLTTILGRPKETKEYLTSWEIEYRGVVVDCILSDPKFSHVTTQKKVFKILKNSPELQKEYINLKEECDGKSYTTYKSRKIEYFNKVLQENA